MLKFILEDDLQSVYYSFAIMTLGSQIPEGSNLKLEETAKVIQSMENIENLKTQKKKNEGNGLDEVYNEKIKNEEAKISDVFNQARLRNEQTEKNKSEKKSTKFAWNEVLGRQEETPNSLYEKYPELHKGYIETNETREDEDLGELKLRLIPTYKNHWYYADNTDPDEQSFKRQ